MKITFMTQNVARGGLHDSKGNYHDRWPALAERINEFKPDILFLNELNNWQDYGHKQLIRAMNDLDMDAAPLSPNESDYGTGILFRRDVMGRWQYHKNSMSHMTTHGFAVTGFDVGLPQLLIVAPVHLSFYSAQKAVEEVQLVMNKTLTQSPFVVVGGDYNHSPAVGSRPDFHSAKSYSWAARTIVSSADQVPVEKFIPDQQVAWTLKRGGMVDVAEELYEKSKDKSLLKPTVEYDRLDQIWMSRQLAPAIESYRLTTKNPEASDHAGVVAIIDTSKATNENWSHEVL
jgi:endonuclease/exonuclease/phosphatase family metal-dependent hydrolase